MIFEITHRNFDASSSDTDHMILWVSAETLKQVEEATRDTGAKVAELPPYILGFDADFELPFDTVAVHQFLMGEGEEY
jgi:hypothetical protein